MECRIGCAACCIALPISSPIPGMPDGKPAGVRCVQLTADLDAIVEIEDDRHGGEGVVWPRGSYDSRWPGARLGR
jgi:hypothetical protein